MRSDADVAGRAKPLSTGVGWLAITVATAAWIVHLSFLAAAMEYTCEHPDFMWALIGVSVLTAVVTIVAAAVCWLLAVRAATDSQRFVGVMGVGLSVVNLVLILAETAWLTVPACQ